MSKKKKTLTTAAGIPVSDNQTSLTAGERGPTLLQDHYLLEKLAHFNRERIPERVVHAKAAGAFGTFTVTKDITKYTRAKIFSEIGKKNRGAGSLFHGGGRKGFSRYSQRCPWFCAKILHGRRELGHGGQ